MPVYRAHVEQTKQFMRARDDANAPYVFGGALSTSVRQGTDCSEIWQTALEMALGRWVPGRQAEGATTESYRGMKVGGPPGPFGTIRVGHWRDIPADAVAKLAFHHGPNGGANSHMWGELDGLRIESRGGDGVVTGSKARPVEDGYGHFWVYLPGPIVNDGTPIPPAPPEVIMLGRRHEAGGDRVKALQLALNRAIGAGLDPDGEFGPMTENAVIAFQRSRNLEADGIAGPVTLRALGLSFATTTPDTAPASAIALLRRVMTPTDITNAMLGDYMPHLAEATRAAEITTVKRAAAWYATLGHESAGLRYMAEIQTNGAGWSDDRRIYRGRGPIQLTWSSNYRKFGQWCKTKGYITDSEMFVKQPTLVEQPRWGFLAASWYWLHAGPRPGQINAFADAGDIVAVSRCVNGWIDGVDPVGMPDRRTRYLNCLALGDQLLTLTTPSTPTDPIEELLMSNEPRPSQSHYRADNKPVLTPMDALYQANAMKHEEMVEAAALRGEIWAIQDLAKLAAGAIPGAHDPDGPFWRTRAAGLLNTIQATRPELITAANPGKA